MPLKYLTDESGSFHGLTAPIHLTFSAVLSLKTCKALLTVADSFSTPTFWTLLGFGSASHAPNHVTFHWCCETPEVL